MKNRKLIILVFLFIIYSISLSSFISADNIVIKRIILQFDKYVKNNYQQKVYLKSDQNIYQAGNIIWFKTYLLNSSSHIPDSTSKNLYIELIDLNKNVILTRILRTEKGFSYGNFELPDTIFDGFYQIRAYTNWMKNYDENYFFSKTIRIINPDNPLSYTKKQLKKDIKIKKKYDIQFFPEGGILISEIKNKVAFKAINKFGDGIDITGRIIDNKNHEYLIFNSLHKGMGVFYFTPEKEKKYFAEIRLPDGKIYKIKIPFQNDEAIKISVDNKKDLIYVNLKCNELFLQNHSGYEFIIIGQIRNKIYLSAPKILESTNKSVVFSKKNLPSGILQLTLFSSRYEPLSERLIFIDNNDKLNIELNTSFNKQDNNKINLDIIVKNSIGEPVSANILINIINDVKTNEKNNRNILSYLLLSSDLKGKVEDPGYYFYDTDSIKSRNLDILMMTQGWRRFVWEKVFNEEYDEKKHEFEKGLDISGKVLYQLFSIPAKNSKVNITVLNQYYEYRKTTTDNEGRFLFRNINLFDIIELKINALNKSDKKNIYIYIDETKSVPVCFDIDSNIYNLVKTSTKKKKLLQIEDTEKDMANKEKSSLNKTHGNASHIIMFDDKMQNYNNIFQAITGKVPGVRVSGNKVIIRGINSIYGGSEPLYLLDDIPVDRYVISNIYPGDVERIEILKGAKASIYGSRGGNGVIAIYTKKGKYCKRGEILFNMLGYHKAKEFYKPAFQNVNDSKTYKTKTVFWKPEIITDNYGKANVSFSIDDNIKNIIIEIEGITNKGKIAQEIIFKEIK